VLARVELQERLERRVRELGRTEEAHRRLSALVVAGAGLPAVCEEIARPGGAPVAVYDARGEPLASAGVGPPERLPDGSGAPACW
jgi:hypothetical protein